MNIIEATEQAERMINEVYGDLAWEIRKVMIANKIKSLMSRK